jgi:hypothetical protein
LGNGCVTAQWIAFDKDSAVKDKPLQLLSESADQWQKLHNEVQRPMGVQTTPLFTYYWGFSWFHNPGVLIHGSIPNWFLILVTGLAAAAVKPKPRLKFTMLDLIVGMTLGAVGLAGLVAFVRSVAIAG